MASNPIAMASIYKHPVEKNAGSCKSRSRALAGRAGEGLTEPWPLRAAALRAISAARCGAANLVLRCGLQLSLLDLGS